MKPVRRVARALLSGIFVIQGAQAVRNPEKLAEAATKVTDRVAPQLGQLHPALAADTRTFVRVNGAVQVVGGVLLNTALHRPAAAVLAGSLVPTTLAGHSFWTAEDPSQRGAQRIQFLKNLSMLGGLLLAAVDTEGAPGLPWRTRHAVHRANASWHRNVEQANREAHRRARTTKDKARLAVRAANVGRHLPG
jgi:putative oxidoreductase